MAMSDRSPQQEVSRLQVDKCCHIMKSRFSPHNIATISTGTSSQLVDFWIVSLTEISRKGRDLVNLDLGRRLSWGSHRSWMILNDLSIFVLFEGWLDQNEFEESGDFNTGKTYEILTQLFQGTEFTNSSPVYLFVHGPTRTRRSRAGNRPRYPRSPRSDL
jgi:hypothetical protein